MLFPGLLISCSLEASFSCCSLGRWDVVFLDCRQLPTEPSFLALGLVDFWKTPDVIWGGSWFSVVTLLHSRHG